MGPYAKCQSRSPQEENDKTRASVSMNSVTTLVMNRIRIRNGLKFNQIIATALREYIYNHHRDILDDVLSQSISN